MLSRQEYHQFCNSLYSLSLDIGLRPACRAIGIPESRGLKIASRRKWNLSKLSPALKTSQRLDAKMSSEVIAPLEAKRRILESMSDRTRLAMSRTAMRAFEHADTIQDSALLSLPAAVALEKHSKIAATAHAWSNQQTNVAVAVNVPLPTDQERDEMRSIDDKLDAIAAKLRSS